MRLLAATSRRADRPHIYRAATLRDALARVRRDLGGGAVILGTREVRRRRLFGLGSGTAIEVTAAAEPPAPPPPARPSIAATPPAASPALRAQIGEQLGRLHAMVDELARRGRVDHLLPDLPSAAVSTYSQLLEAEIPEPMALRLASEVADRLGDSAVAAGPHAARAALIAAVEAMLPIAAPIAVEPGRRRVVALVGPTGVGKTTTVAKLAAAFRLVRGVRTGLVTVDTFRVAAVEQLRTYAEIIDLPLAVADTPGSMRAAVDALGPVDLVLIDTAGRSPRDEVRIRELAGFLAEARPDEVHLVLSAAASERGLRQAVLRFAAARADRLILTKLDEAEGLGPALAVAAEAGLPLSYLTTGQAVPDDIEPADRARLARLALGHEPVDPRGADRSTIA